MYYFINWVHTAEGYRPALPEDLGFLLLAEPGTPSKGATFALFRCDLPDTLPFSEAIVPVPDHLAGLLNSAKDYPPALALVRDYLYKMHSLSKSEFTETLVQQLHFHLDRQRTAPYILAAARVTETGYKESGSYYWIVGYQRGMVAWVSRDYFIYHDPVEHFDLDHSDLEHRFTGMEDRPSG